MIGTPADRALARVEWRNLVRHRGRALLLMLLVAIPVAAVAGGATIARIVTPSAEEQRRAAMGRGALGVDGLVTPADRERMLALLPAGTPTTAVFSGRERVIANGRSVQALLLAAAPEAWAPPGLAEGLLHFDNGRPPANAGEVAISRVLAAALAVAPGDSLTLEYGARRVVTAVVVDPSDIDKSLVLRTPAAVEHGGAWSIVAALSDTDLAPTVAKLREAGFHVTTRDQLHDGGDALSVAMLILGVIGLFEAGLVMAAAFAVGLQRRRYEIGLLGSAGAPAFRIERALMGSALIVAVAGGLFGMVVGLGCAALAHPFLDTLNRRLNGDFEFRWLDLVLSIVLGMAAAGLAVAWPARQAARVPVREALGGRRPPGKATPKGPLAGLALVGIGVMMLQLARQSSRWLVGTGVLGGPILTLIGFGLLSPWLLEQAARAAAQLPLGWRLAVRDAGRFRDRHAPVVTAVLAGMALSVAVGVLTTSVETAIDRLPSSFRNDHLLVDGPGSDRAAARLATELHAVGVAPLSAAYADGQPLKVTFAGTEAPRGTRAWVATGDEALLAVFGLEKWREEFRAGHLLALDPWGKPDSLRVTKWNDGAALAAPPLTGVPIDQAIGSPRFLIAAEALPTFHFESGPPLNKSFVPWLLRLPNPVTPELLARARRAIADSPGVTIDAELLHDRPAQAIYRVALVVCLLTGLGVVLVATALSAAESASDEVILHAVGAPPGQLRAHRGWRAAWLALVGCLLAVPVGMTMVMGLRYAGNFPLAIVVPWGDLLLAFVALPLLAFLGAWFGGKGHSSAAPGAAMARPSVVSAVVIVLGLSGAGSAIAAEALRWEPYLGQAFDGAQLAGELTYVVVPENRSRPNGRTIRLAVVRYRTTNPRPGPPIVFLAGGPGGSGVELAGRELTHPQIRLLESRDVIGFDQRGTGMTYPNFDWPEFGLNLPADRPVTRDEVAAAWDRAAARCAEYWQAAGVDLEAYDTNASADDVDDVRLALGLERIALYGASYGSHLGLACLRRHPEGIERAFLANVEGPDDTWKFPSTTQRAFEALHERLQKSGHPGAAYEDLIGTFRRLSARLDSTPMLTHKGFTGMTSEDFVIGPFDLECAVARMMGRSAASQVDLPGILEMLEEGMSPPLASWGELRREMSVTLMPLLMDCASGGSPERLARIERERRDPANILGDALMAPFYPSACRALGVKGLGEDYRKPFPCDIPVLFVSGTLDVRTPPENVEALLPGFTHATHVVAENAGHDSRELMSPEYRALFQAFWRGERVASCRILLPPVPLPEPTSRLMSPRKAGGSTPGR